MHLTITITGVYFPEKLNEKSTRTIVISIQNMKTNFKSELVKLLNHFKEHMDQKTESIQRLPRD